MSLHRHPAQSTPNAHSADDFGLIAWLENTRIRLSLRGVETRFQITGTLARVEINSVFQNPRGLSLDISYLFPLPAGASVYRCELIAQGRTIAAVIEEERAAREQFARAKAEGRRAAIVEARRDNLFNLCLGNIHPGEIVAIRLAYVQELERAVRTVSLRIPVCPGERYIPGRPLLRSNQGNGTLDDTDQVPDASLISPPRIDQLHPDAALFHLCGELPAGNALPAGIVSPSHAIAVRVAEGPIRIGFAADGNLPDRDFILRWEMPALEPGTAQLLSGHTGDRHYGLLRLMPPTPPATTTAAPRQLWFLIDRSGSMAGEKWTKTCLALHDCVAGLSPEDRVFITLFDDRPQHFAEKPLAPATLLADPRFRTLVALGTGGGTELLPALQEILQHASVHRDASFHPHLILITDGQVGNEAAIRSALKPHAGHLAVHTIGIDFAVNDGLLKQLAEDNGGRSMFISPAESVSEAVELVLLGSGARALHTLRLGDGLSSARRLPDMLVSGLETTLLITGKSPADSPVLQALTADASTWTCTPTPIPGDGTVLHLIHARREIDRLQSAGNQSAALALARETNLLCLGASFIAIDRESKVPIASVEFQQPSFRSGMVFELMQASSAERPSAGICEKIFQCAQDDDLRDLEISIPATNYPVHHTSPDFGKGFFYLTLSEAFARVNLPKPTGLFAHLHNWVESLRDAEASLHQLARNLRNENPGLAAPALSSLLEYKTQLTTPPTGQQPGTAASELLKKANDDFHKLACILFPSGYRTVQELRNYHVFVIDHARIAALALAPAENITTPLQAP